MASVLLVCGSASVRSPVTPLLYRAAALLAAGGHRTDMLNLGYLPAQALLHLDVKDGAMADAVRIARDADAIVLGSPVHNNAYSALLKAWLDSLGHRGLEGTLVTTVSTGRSSQAAHRVDLALAPVLAALGAVPAIGHGCFVPDSCVQHQDGRYTLDAPAEIAVSTMLAALNQSLVERGLVAERVDRHDLAVVGAQRRLSCRAS